MDAQAHAPHFVARPVCVRHVTSYIHNIYIYICTYVCMYVYNIAHGAPIQGGQENPRPLRENRPFMVAPVTCSLRGESNGFRAQPLARLPAFAPSTLKFDCRLRRGRKDTGKRCRQLVVNSFFLSAAKWQAARFYANYSISFFFPFPFLLFHFFYSSNKARNNDPAMV